jgi:hypothetical protein
LKSLKTSHNVCLAGDSDVIYTIWPDESDYEWINTIDVDSVNIVDMMGSRAALAPDWTPVKVRRVHPTSNRKKAKEADFPWYGSHILFMRPRAVEALRPILEKHAEILPVIDDSGAELYAVNVLTVVDGLDEAKSDLKRFTHGGIMRIVRHEFRPKVIAELDMFRIPQFRASQIFVSQTFVDAVQDAGLTGVRFQAVWKPAEA